MDASTAHADFSVQLQAESNFAQVLSSTRSECFLVSGSCCEVVGVAFQKMVARGVELQASLHLHGAFTGNDILAQGHAVPSPVIQRFLEDVASHSHSENSICSVGCSFLGMSSRRKFGEQ